MVTSLFTETLEQKKEKKDSSSVCVMTHGSKNHRSIMPLDF